MCVGKNRTKTKAFVCVVRLVLCGPQCAQSTLRVGSHFDSLGRQIRKSCPHRHVPICERSLVSGRERTRDHAKTSKKQGQQWYKHEHEAQAEATSEADADGGTQETVDVSARRRNIPQQPRNFRRLLRHLRCSPSNRWLALLMSFSGRDPVQVLQSQCSASVQDIPVVDKKTAEISTGAVRGRGFWPLQG